MIFNEKPSKMDATLFNIVCVVESGGELGGIQVDIKINIPTEVDEAFKKVFEGFVGSKVTAFALLCTQVTKGVNYIFGAKVALITVNPVDRVAIVIINPMTGDISFTEILGTKTDALQLGYSFTWLKKQSTSLWGTLGEWP